MSKSSPGYLPCSNVRLIDTLACGIYYVVYTNNMTNGLISLLESNGASLVGIADLKEIDPEARVELPYGISIAVALNPRIVSGILNV
jgi:hypothetical protein